MPSETVKIDFGLFAHNEADGIAAMVGEVARQSVFQRSNIDARLLILVNGSSDDTARIAKAAIPEALAQRIVVLDIAKGGKSRTVHRFIHTDARADCDLLGFMDADIRLPDPDTLARMVEAMQARPMLSCFTSRPVKDVDHDKLDVGPVAKLIAAGGGGLTDWRNSICGQLYVLRGRVARDIGLPLGLPVEDGFMRALVVTDLFSREGDTDVIDGSPEVFHVYQSIRGLGELLHHQTRIVVGSAVNAALYRHFRRFEGDKPALRTLLMGAAQAEGWLTKVLRAELPQRPFGFVPFGFLTKRLSFYRKTQPEGLKPKVVLALGLAFDAVIWCFASWRMWRGQAVGFW